METQTTTTTEEFELVHEGASGFVRRPLPSTPSLVGDQVLIRPRWVGICGSDLYLIEVHDGPLRLGHEWIGVVERVGPHVHDFQVGDAVTSTGTVACFECGPCHNEKTNYCDSATYFSSDKIGALRSWFVLDEKQLTRVEGPLDKSFALHELLSVAETAVDLVEANAPYADDRELLILGGGPVGLLTALVAKDRGYRPMLIEKLEFRLDLAKKLGVDACSLGRALLDPSFRQRYRLVVDASHDYAKETGAFRFLTMFVKKDFSLVMVGKYKGPQEIPVAFNSLGGKITWMRGVPHGVLSRSVAKWTSRLGEFADAFITHVFSSDQTSEAFAVATEKANSMKVLIEISRPGHHVRVR